MKIKIYALSDKDAEQLKQVTFNAPNDKVAKRIIKNSLENDKALAKNAKAYELRCVGEFDTEEPEKTEKVCELEEIKSEMSAENE
uniref:Nonstructural protein n=1 Tax=Dulem virus 207 TaxID=3145684 RepID=A0AAU8B191_9VIRU